MLGDSPKLKSENSKRSGLDSLHVRNQVSLDDEKLVCLRTHMWIQYVLCRLPHVKFFYLELIIISSRKGKKRNNSDADNMYVNTLFQVTQKSCVSHFQILLK